MSSTTSGGFSPLSQNADLSKEVGSHAAVIPAGGNVAQVVNPSVPQQAFTAFNLSNQVIRGTIAFSAGINAVGAAATRTFLIPPQGFASQDFGSSTDDINGALEAIDSITYQAVVVTATAEASALVAAPALVANAVILTNFATR